MNTLNIVCICIIVIAIVLTLIVVAVKLFKMKPEERKEFIITFLVGLVTAAENTFTEQGSGTEKVKWVEEQFKAKAGWFLKLVLLMTKSADLQELIEKALNKAKTTQWDKK